jgi:hypothetical protein
MKLPTWLQVLRFEGTRARAGRSGQRPVRRKVPPSLERLDERLVLSSGRGGFEALAVANPTATDRPDRLVRQLVSEPLSVSGRPGNLTGVAALSPSGPGYPSPPATGAALRGDTRSLFAASPLAVSLQGSDVAVIPTLAMAPTGGNQVAFAGSSLAVPMAAGVVTDVPAESFVAASRSPANPAAVRPDATARSDASVKILVEALTALDRLPPSARVQDAGSAGDAPSGALAQSQCVSAEAAGALAFATDKLPEFMIPDAAPVLRDESVARAATTTADALPILAAPSVAPEGAVPAGAVVAVGARAPVAQPVELLETAAGAISTPYGYKVLLPAVAGAVLVELKARRPTDRRGRAVTLSGE